MPKSRAKNSKTNSEKERYKISCNLGQLNDQTIGGPLNFTYIKYGDDPTLVNQSLQPKFVQCTIFVASVSHMKSNCFRLKNSIFSPLHFFSEIEIAF